MSYIDKITNKDTGESRVISPAAEAVRVSNENYEGENLDEVLDEVAHAIEDAGSGDGTVTGVKIGSTTYEPTDGVVDLSAPMSNKVDKNGTDSLMTAAEHTKLGNLPTADQLATQMNAKANDNAVVKTISVNGGQAQTPTNGNVNISVEGAAGEDGITPHIGQNDNWWIGPETDPNNDTGVKAQGPMGSVTITDGALATLEVHNALNANTGILGMGGAMKLKNNIDAVQANLVKLYNKLANMAFWDAEDQADAEPIPTLLDWSIPKKTVTLDKTDLDSNSIITDSSDNEITGTTVQVDEGGSFTFKIKPKANYALTAASASVGGSAIQPDSTTGGIYTFTVSSVASDITVVLSSTALANRTVTIDNQVGASIVIKKDGTPLSGTTVTVASGGNLTLTVEAADDYSINSLDAKVNNVSLNPTESSGVYTITASSISSDITIVITGSTTYSGWLTVPKSDVGSPVTTYGMQQGRYIDASKGCIGSSVNNGTPSDIIMPAGYPYNVKRFTSADTGNGNIQTNPGKTTACYFATGGKRYVNIRLTDSQGTTGYTYKVSVGCYGNAVIDNTQNDGFQNSSTLIDGFFTRPTPYPTANANIDDVNWKFDLFSLATNNGGSNGDITYVKFVITKVNNSNSATVTSDDYINNLTVEYKFTDD